MKTYSEKKGHDTFNWIAELNKEDSEIDWEELEYKSCFWTTCACGNLCDIIPR